MDPLIVKDRITLFSKSSVLTVCLTVRNCIPASFASSIFLGGFSLS